MKTVSLKTPCIILIYGLWPVLAQSAGLPDTGQQRCYDGNTGSMVACNAANTGNATPYSAQDGRIGRDAAATAGQLTKIGGGEAGFDYTKVCNSGELQGQGDCPVDPPLGVGSNDWGCNQDNITGLMWEVKVNDDTHLRHKDWHYTWYNPDASSNGGNAGLQDTGIGVGSDYCVDASRCDTQQYTDDVNAANLCNHNDWRLPSRRELLTLVHLGRGDSVNPAPTIDQGYFPNTVSSEYWTGSTSAIWVNNVRIVQFYSGNGSYADKLLVTDFLRLVRGGRL